MAELRDAGPGGPVERDEVALPAHAKINVFLRVLGRRDDGYHDLESLILPVSLSDDVVVRRQPHVSASVRLPDGRPLLLSDPMANLALRAAAEWYEARPGKEEGASVEVEKRIPVASGLGGGSADAATTLRALNELWGRPFGAPELAGIGARLGSDVPALLDGGPVLVGGRGEIVEPVVVAPMWWVLLPQPFGVRSAEAYAWWDEEPGSSDRDVAAVLEAARGGRVERLARLLFNDLQAPVARRHAQVQVAVERLLDAGALGAAMSGSGPTVAGLVANEEDARRIEDRVPGAIAVTSPPPRVPSGPA
ncbi:MAG TPA: 4-(cytidine 5'-diphospho)-2-C-methyl-D-erythritol kinase [Actinomycetota bacterium]